MLIFVHVVASDGIDEGAAERMLLIALGKTARSGDAWHQGKQYKCWTCSPDFADQFIDDCRLCRMQVDVFARAEHGFVLWGSTISPTVARPVVDTPSRLVS